MAVAEACRANSETGRPSIPPQRGCWPLLLQVFYSKLWQAGSPMEIVEFSELIALRAQRFMQDALSKLWSLKPADAIHTATADQLKVPNFISTMSPLSKCSVLTKEKFSIAPSVSVRQTSTSAECSR